MHDHPDTVGGLAFAHHDHAHCAGDALARADALAGERGARLTPVRRRTLEILLESHRAMGAYEVLERLEVEFQPLAREKRLELRIVQTTLWVASDRRLLRRLLDGRNIGDAVFDAYLDGTLHFASRLRRSA